MMMLQKKTNNYNPNWPQIPDHSYRILIFGGSGFEKTNALLNTIKKQGDDNYSVIDKYIYLLKIQMKQHINILLTPWKYLSSRIEQAKGIEYLYNMQNVYKNIKEYNPGRKCNILIVLDYMIADIISIKKLNQVLEKEKNKYFYCFFHTNLFHSYQKMLD